MYFTFCVCMPCLIVCVVPCVCLLDTLESYCLKDYITVRDSKTTATLRKRNIELGLVYSNRFSMVECLITCTQTWY